MQFLKSGMQCQCMHLWLQDWPKFLWCRRCCAFPKCCPSLPVDIQGTAPPTFWIWKQSCGNVVQWTCGESDGVKYWFPKLPGSWHPGSPYFLAHPSTAILNLIKSHKIWMLSSCHDHCADKYVCLWWKWRGARRFLKSKRVDQNEWVVFLTQYIQTSLSPYWKNILLMPALK